MKSKADHHSKNARKKKRKGYWSVMLVGEHGRVIPFKHFKELTIGVLVLLLLTSSALALLGFWYVRQQRLVEHLQAEIAHIREEAANVRDEKDLLLAELIINRKSVASESPAPSPDKQKASPAGESGPPAAAAPAPPAPPAPKTENPASQPTTFKARISHFGADYNPAGALLTVKFRINNATPGRKPLSGRIVVVLNAQDDPAVQRVAIPGAAFSAGQPVHQKGQAFQVNNYRTMEFKLHKPAMPITFNSAEIFVYTEDGKTILEEAFGFEIEHEDETPELPDTTEGSSAQVSEAAAKPTAAAPQGIEPALPQDNLRESR
jgi:hypothetical protein